MVSERNLLKNTFYCNFTYINLTAPLIFVRILYCREKWLRWPRSRCHCPGCRRTKVLLPSYKRASKVQEIDCNERPNLEMTRVLRRYDKYRLFDASVVRLFSWALLSLSGFTTKVVCSNFGEIETVTVRILRLHKIDLFQDSPVLGPLTLNS